jgi:MFS family permease
MQKPSALLLEFACNCITKKANVFLKCDLRGASSHVKTSGRNNGALKHLFGSSKKGSNTKSASNDIKISSSAWRTCLFLSASVILVLFVHTSLSPALPLFVSEFEITYNLASWALTAYMISGAVMTIIIGRLADLFGSRKMLLIELACFAVGTAIAGFAQDFYSLLIIRALQGVAVANTPLALKLVREKFPKEKFSVGASIIIASFSGGMVVGLVLGAQIVGELGWRDVFYISAPIAFALLFIAWRYIGKDRRRDEPLPKKVEAASNGSDMMGDHKSEGSAVAKKREVGIDVRGAIALAVSLTSFLLAITFAGTIPSTTTEFAVFLVVGIVSLVIFFMLE